MPDLLLIFKPKTVKRNRKFWVLIPRIHKRRKSEILTIFNILPIINFLTVKFKKYLQKQENTKLNL